MVVPIVLDRMPLETCVEVDACLHLPNHGDVGTVVSILTRNVMLLSQPALAASGVCLLLFRSKGMLFANDIFIYLYFLEEEGYFHIVFNIFQSI